MRTTEQIRQENQKAANCATPQPHPQQLPQPQPHPHSATAPIDPSPPTRSLDPNVFEPSDHPTMYGGMTGAPPPGAGGHYGPGAVRPAMQSGGGGGGGQQQRHDIFVGNLAFSTTEESLHQAFSELGRIVKVRMVTDQETGKPRGFAFIEFEDPQAALSAIRNMNDYELNGRRIRVNFSNSSHLEQLAGKLGMDMSAHTAARQQAVANKAAGAGTVAVADSLKAMGKGEMYDVIKQLKEVAEKDPDAARKLLCGHPQLPEAVLFLMSKLDMIKTPVATEAIGAPGTDMTAAAAAAPARPADPRAAAAAPAAPSDPRARDPRAAARAQPSSQPPPMMQQPPQPPLQQPPPPPPGQYGAAPPAVVPAVAGLDPALVQQVMSLTPEQIALLPPDKQQSIIALRQQITGAR